MRLCLVLIAIVFSAALPARAPQAANALQVEQAWKILDQCRKEAFAKFPDQTSQGQQQRDKYVKACKAARGVAPLGQD